LGFLGLSAAVVPALAVIKLPEETPPAAKKPKYCTVRIVDIPRGAAVGIFMADTMEKVFLQRCVNGGSIHLMVWEAIQHREIIIRVRKAGILPMEWRIMPYGDLTLAVQAIRDVYYVSQSDDFEMKPK